MTRTCPTCGSAIPATAPGGECPVCLLALSLAPPLPRDFAPASPAAVQAQFPALAVLELVGRGGMGAVYKARQTSLNRIVALKILAPELAVDPELVERFLREAQAMARLSHPHIVGVFDVGRTAESAFIVMEFVEGPSLRERLRSGRLAPLDALKLVPQLCDAIQYAHDRGVIHRDIKPENVLLDAEGRAKIADFGLAKFDDGADFALTGSDVRMGTARYMAPEQWRNTAAVDHRADIYSLGVMFYEMLTGDLPGPQSKPPSAKAGTDRRLDGVVARSMQEEPAQRYQRAAEIKTDLQRIAENTRRLQYLLAALAAAVLVVGAVVAAIMLRGEKIADTAGKRTEEPPKAPRGTAPTPGIKNEPRPAPKTPTEFLTSPDYEWTPPENLGDGANTEHDEGAPFITDDGLTLLFRSNRPGGHGDADLWMAKRKSLADPFGDAENLGPAINSDAGDDAPFLTPDECTLYFVSNRGGRIDTDIWMARRAARDAPWGEPERLGPEVNSESHEFRPWLSRDGLRLTFSSLRPPREGIWMCRRAASDAPFDAALPFSPDANKRALSSISFSADDRTLLCNRMNSVVQFRGDLLWMAKIDAAGEPFRNLVSLGPVVNSGVPGVIETSPVVSLDGRTLYFTSTRDGGRGGYDLWRSHRVPKRG